MIMVKSWETCKSLLCIDTVLKSYRMHFGQEFSPDEYLFPSDVCVQAYNVYVHMSKESSNYVNCGHIFSKAFLLEQGSSSPRYGQHEITFLKLS